MERVNETVNEYLKRGGTITTLPPNERRHTSLFVALCGAQGRVQEERKDIIGTLDCTGTYIAPDTDKKDKQYWKKLNKRLDSLIRLAKKRTLSTQDTTLREKKLKII